MKNFSDLTRLARTLVMDVVPEESRQSLPVVVGVNQVLQVAFMFCPALARPGVTKLAPPHYVAWLDAGTGALSSLKQVTPSFFAQPHGKDDLIGEFRLPEGMNVDQYLAQRDRLFQLLGQLAPLWATDPAAKRRDLQASAQEFLRLFGSLSEAPLTPYYYALGSEFFNWVRALAK
jgi:hypothetical protein